MLHLFLGNQRPRSVRLMRSRVAAGFPRLSVSNPTRIPMKLQLVPVLALLLPALPLAGQSISTNKSDYVVGEHVAVSFTGSTSPRDWVGIFPTGAPHAPGHVYWRYTNGTTSATASVVPGGTIRFLPFSVPQGYYDVRLYADDGYAELARTTIHVVSGAESPVPPPVADLTVMTFNIWRGATLGGGGAGEQAVVDAIAKAGADVIALQEVNDATQLQTLAALLRAKPGYSGLHVSSEADVLSRFPIVDTYTAGLAGYGVKIELSPGSHIRFFNSHLTHTSYGPYTVRDGGTVAQALAGEGSTRLPEIQAILSILVD
ncbi:MAG: endonuclease/exonuclease/phosphatase family protein [Planctomycetota bacterium]